MTIGDTGEYGGLVYKPDGQFGEPQDWMIPVALVMRNNWT